MKSNTSEEDFFRYLDELIDLHAANISFPLGREIYERERRLLERHKGVNPSDIKVFYSPARFRRMMVEFGVDPDISDNLWRYDEKLRNLRYTPIYHFAVLLDSSGSGLFGFPYMMFGRPSGILLEDVREVHSAVATPNDYAKRLGERLWQSE
jgi:hypothetical protein